MGIPFYFKNLVNSFGNNFLRPIKHIEECDTLYLDFNGMIHGCASEVIKKYPSLKYEEYYPFIFDAIIDAIISVINIVRPKKMLYIAIDGLCPRAKMQQQRKRRYMTVWRKQFDKDSNIKWDSNVITPGTDFMKYLDNKLEEFIIQNEKKLNFKIVLSKSSEKGEGEHKMFQVMENGEDSVIFGLDADLIMLSMISPNHENIRLLRETNKKGNISFNFLLIKNLRAEIMREHNIPINDYIMLCVILGNDFLPPLSYMSIRDHGIEKLIEVYKECGECIITDNTLNMQVFYNIFKRLAISEDNNMAKACSIYYSAHAKDDNIDLYPQYSKCPYIINPNIDIDWRDTYYKNIMRGDINTACELYIKGIEWVFTYYFKKNASFSWYYPYCYSPTINDLAKRANNAVSLGHDIENLDKISNLQLLLVLPPQSSHILKNNAQEYMTNLTLGCCHMYPQTFKISTFLKTFVWECSPILPEINIDKFVIQSML